MGAYVRISKRKEGSTTYHKHGKAYCSGHQIRHDELDSIIFYQLALYQSGLLREGLFLEMTQESSVEPEKLKRLLSVQVATALDILNDRIIVYARKGQGLDIEVVFVNDNALAEVI